MFCTRPTSCPSPPNPPLLSLTLTLSDPHIGCLPPHRKERGSPQPLEGLCSLLCENRISYCHYIYTTGTAKEHVLKALHALRGPNSPAPYDPVPTSTLLYHTALGGCYFYSKSRLIVKLIINQLTILIYLHCTSSFHKKVYPLNIIIRIHSHSYLVISLLFIAHIPIHTCILVFIADL